MSSNYDQIATVDIDIENPMVDKVSLGNLLIIGPRPAVISGREPSVFGMYTELDYVSEAGWKTSGEGADPVGEAAKVAFSQKPKPDHIYIAPVQLTGDAVAAGAIIGAVAEAFAETISTGSYSNFNASYDAEKRILLANMTAEFTEEEDKTVFHFLKAVIDAGYTVTSGGTAVTDFESFKTIQAYTQMSQLEQGDSTAQFIFEAADKDGVKAPFGVIVAYPQPGGSGAMPEFTAGTIENPQTETESALETVQRAMSYTGWYAVCPAGISDEEYQEISDYIELQEKLFIYTERGFFNGEAAMEGDPEPTVKGELFRTIALFAMESASQKKDELTGDNRYMNVAFAAMWFNYESGSETTVHKKLIGMTPAALSTKEIRQLNDKNVYYYISMGNTSVTMNGKVLAGEWADTIRFRDWLKTDMQTRVVNLFMAVPKIPFTDSGIALIQNQMIASLKEGQNVGGIAPEEFDEDGNAIVPYSTSVPLAASISAEQRNKRRLTNCTFRARLSGAIHFAEIKGSLTVAL